MYRLAGAIGERSYFSALFQQRFSSVSSVEYMESMQSIRPQQPAINHRMIAHAEAAFMHIRQQAVIRGRASLFMSATEGRAGKECKNKDTDGKDRFMKSPKGRLKMRKQLFPHRPPRLHSTHFIQPCTFHQLTVCTLPQKRFNAHTPPPE